MLTIDEIKRLASLARIELHEKEAEGLQKDLSAVLDYVEALKQVNAEGLKEVNQVTGLVNVQRIDKVFDHGNRQEILSQAPEMKDGYFKVKAIL